MKTVSAQSLLTAPSGAVVYDTRPPNPRNKEISGAKRLSLEAVQAGELPDLPKDTPIYLLCERGQVSELVGLYLEAAGFENVHNVAGGMTAWREAHSEER